MTDFNGDGAESYPTQRRLVDAFADHHLHIEQIRTPADVVRIRIPIEDARRLTVLLKETRQ